MKFFTDRPEQPQPGQMIDGTASAGVNSGDVTALVDMVRPEDRASKPVTAQVPADEVPAWEKQGWVTKG